MSQFDSNKDYYGVLGVEDNVSAFGLFKARY